MAVRFRDDRSKLSGRPVARMGPDIGTFALALHANRIGLAFQHRTDTNPARFATSHSRFPLRLPARCDGLKIILARGFAGRIGLQALRNKDGCILLNLEFC